MTGFFYRNGTQMKKQKKNVEFRYYDIPKGEYVLPKLGDGWVMEYGKGSTKADLHFHNYMEIGYCYYGDGELIIEDRNYRYDRDNFSIIPKNVVHTTLSIPGHKDKWEFVFVDIDSFIRNEMKDVQFNVEDIIRQVNSRGTMKTQHNHPYLARIILSIIRECRMDSPYQKIALKGLLYLLVIEILRLNEERDSQIRKVNKVNSYLTDSIEFIGKHYNEDIHVGDLAEISGLSESHYRRLFEESMNMKPLEYVNMIRIDRACELIRQGEMSMEEIAYKVGFQTLSTFHRNFAKLTGISPLQWKKSSKGQSVILPNMHITAKKGWESGEEGLQ